MKLSTLLEGVKVTETRGNPDVEISSVCSDSRLVREGALFVAVAGFKVDGARFVDSALAKGAAAVLAEALPSVSSSATVVKTPDAREALAVVAGNFYGRPAAKLQLVGVTGTSGKTTTTKMLESIFDATGEPVGLIGTIDYRAGELTEIADRTTPDAIVLQEWLARMVEARVTRAVMEVSSHALALKRSYGISFAAAVFTNISRDHFDFHRDFEDYFSAKKILFDQIDRSRRTAVVNADDVYGRRLLDELGAAAWSFGRETSSDIHPAPGFEISVRGLRGEVVTPSGNVAVESPLLGVPNLYNWMGAIGASLAVGVAIPTIQRGIEALQTVRGRFESVSIEGGPTVLVDYAHKPDALEKLLHAVRELAAGKKLVVVFGCGGDRDRGKRPEMGEIAGRLADLSIITSDNPRSEDPEKIIDQIEEGMRRTKGVHLRIADRREAIDRAVSEAGDDTMVVIAGKGHENYQVIGDEIAHFDDREEVESALRKKSHKSGTVK
ncbi:MAG TPA: UDP-N-acetylmuramoyl-L-alanyl-D-glutamate--2,6-diaminopimelate ligase [Thermoanaerobaculia bacterium]|nr:UDP-N-acetylmuramoyl-L-alanyl-D-glutamate--2,6-diaminopimelate ligase [Thermoanaerobaculia bacterium]